MAQTPLRIPVYIINILRMSYGGLVALSLGTLLLSAHCFLCDLLVHFQLQYALLLSLLLATCLVLRRFRDALFLAGYLAMLGAFFIYPLALFPETPPPQTTVYFKNTFYPNHQTSGTLAEIRESKPAIVALVEQNRTFTQELTALYGSPHVVHEQGPLSCAIFSHQPPRSTKVHAPPSVTFPICTAQYPNFTLVIIHPTNPLSPTLRRAQISNLEEVHALIQTLEEKNTPFLLVGDFNASYYSGTFRRLFGSYFRRHLYSWQTDLLFGIPIDHALSSHPITVRRGKQLHSDHVGLFISLD